MGGRRSEAKEVVEACRPLHAAQRQAQDLRHMTQQVFTQPAIKTLCFGQHLQQAIGLITMAFEHWFQLLKAARHAFTSPSLES